MLQQLEWGYKELQRELGRGIFSVWALVGCPGLRFTLWSQLGLRKRESQELQLGGRHERDCKRKGWVAKTMCLGGVLGVGTRWGAWSQHTVSHES